MIFEICATVALVLSIFNTIILLRRSLIHKVDLLILIAVMEFMLKFLRSMPADDMRNSLIENLIEQIKKIAREHVK